MKGGLAQGRGWRWIGLDAMLLLLQGKMERDTCQRSFRNSKTLPDKSVRPLTNAVGSTPDTKPSFKVEGVCVH